MFHRIPYVYRTKRITNAGEELYNGSEEILPCHCNYQSFVKYHKCKRFWNNSKSLKTVSFSCTWGTHDVQKFRRYVGTKAASEAFVTKKPLKYKWFSCTAKHASPIAAGKRKIFSFDIVTSIPACPFWYWRVGFVLAFWCWRVTFLLIWRPDRNGVGKTWGTLECW